MNYDHDHDKEQPMTTTPAIQIKLSRDDLLARLHDQHKVAKQYDKQRAVEHRAAEKATLDEWRAKCRDAAKWSYDVLREVAKHNRHGAALQVDLPSCPAAMAPRFIQAIESVRLSNQQEFTLQRDNIHSFLHGLVTWDPNPQPEDVCS